MKNLPSSPARIAKLPVDERGYPVPFFVMWIDGKPDFRVIDPAKMIVCFKQKRCWICGDVLGKYLAFVIGPMCAINRISSEPPSHLECAEFAAKACPFLTMPKAHRREGGKPEGAKFSSSGLKRNPGVALVWVTINFEPFRSAPNEILFKVGSPVKVLWFCEGRSVTRAEVLHSIETGLPIVREMAANQGIEAVALLEKQCRDAERFYPV